jgi:hypothetical protein
MIDPHVLEKSPATARVRKKWIRAREALNMAVQEAKL